MATNPSIKFGSDNTYALSGNYAQPTYTSGALPAYTTTNAYEQTYQPTYNQPSYNYVPAGLADNRNTTGYYNENRTVTVPSYTNEVRNTYAVGAVGTASVTQQPRVVFNHPSGGYANAASFTTNTVYQPPRVETNNVIVNSNLPTQTVTVQNTEIRESAKETGPVSTLKASAPVKENDEFLCSKTGWIIGALVGLALLTLALLYGLGVIGGPIGSGKVAAAAPTISTPSVPTLNAGKVALPTLNAGKVTLPTVNTGAVTLPSVPTLNAPTISTGSTSVSAIPLLNSAHPTSTSTSTTSTTTTTSTSAPHSTTSTTAAIAPHPSTSTTSTTAAFAPHPETYTPFIPLPTGTHPVYSTSTTTSTTTSSSQPSVRPASVLPVAVSPVAYSAPTSTTATSFEPSTISYQPSYSTGAFLPQPVDLEPVSVAPVTTTTSSTNWRLPTGVSPHFISAVPV